MGFGIGRDCVEIVYNRQFWFLNDSSWKLSVEINMKKKTNTKANATEN